MSNKTDFSSSVHFPPFMGEEEIEAVIKVLKSKRLTLISGNRVSEFEKKFASYIGVKYAVAVNSGTAALHTCLASLDLGPGDEVIIPPFTFIATASSVLHQNAIPIFADIDPDTYCINPEAVKSAITENTKAIIPVHLFGHPANMDPLMEIAEKNELYIIEDACQAHGALYKGKKVGSIGQLGCFSFFESKNMMCGEGGMITTNNQELAEKCRLIRHHGEPSWYKYVRLGYNYRMTEIQAALGMVQLNKLDLMNERRIKYAKYYNKNLRDILGIKIPYAADNVKHVYHLYAPLIAPQEIGITKDRFLAKLNEMGTVTKLIYPEPLYKSPLFQRPMGYGPEKCPFTCPYYNKEISYEINLPVVEDICNRVIGLSNFPSLEMETIEKIINLIKNVIGDLKDE
ncbi:MAG: aminotransferase class I/II-fold pyridoxal phosphate-dependent enzyme [Candidatus Lokiarchaeota archaeon]|nr:aminotransferase class I/II-fold pyridoxal phosphate-dependent enzyme [Candidatus Lokiarchaeota archaeon]